MKPGINIYKATFLFCLILGLSSCALTGKKASQTPVSNLKPDESVLILPTNMYFSDKANKWIIPVHGWVFESEGDDLLRAAFVSSLKLVIDVDASPAHKKNFDTRLQMFLVDNERNKRVMIKVNGQEYLSPASQANGHFEFEIQLDKTQIECNEIVRLDVMHVDTGLEWLPSIPLHYVQCPNGSNLSVISDIDDTIKDSNVLDKKVLMKNTFLEDFKPIKGMPEVYQRWQKQGMSFHYVSSSPWQLYPFLMDFMKQHKFPFGSMHLKLVRVKDSSVMNLFDSPEEGKIPSITSLLTKYPQRKFVLVGDSGEKDAEIYASVMKQYPKRIVKIFIHDIRNTPESRQHLNNVFKDFSKDKWQVFTDPEELPKTISF